MLVAQLGARRHYGVPAALQKYGMLTRFVTDITSGGHLKRSLIAAAGKCLQSKSLVRWAGRDTSVIPREKIISDEIFGLLYRLRSRLALTQEARRRVWLWGGKILCNNAVRQISGEVNGVYAFSTAANNLFRYCRDYGCVSILDHATAPQEQEVRLVREEMERYPGWAVPGYIDSGGAFFDQYIQQQRSECTLADGIICGSSFVKRMLETEGVSSEILHVVPLGMPLMPISSLPDRQNEDSLRVLFVGEDGLRKGVGDLAAACKSMKSGKIDLRAVGGLALTEKARKELSRYMELVGSVPRSQMARQYDWADLMVLPSLSDTFGLVILEAMAHGLPVVVTPNTAGPDIIRNGIEGFVVPIRSPECIAEKLDLLLTNPGLLREMSHAALSRSSDFGFDAYSKRLAEAVRNIYETR